MKEHCPPFECSEGKNASGKREFKLVSKKKVVIADRPRDEVYFAGIIIQKGYVGFYYMPIYVDTNLKKEFSEDFLNNLKGKSCIYIKRWDKDIEKEVKKALKIGLKQYKDKGWV